MSVQEAGNIDIEMLDIMIKEGKIDHYSINNELGTKENLNYLFLFDRITHDEIRSYWNVSKVAAWRRVKKNSNASKVSRFVDASQRRKYYSPIELFEDIAKYCDFLIWRAKIKNEIKIEFVAFDIACEILRLKGSQLRSLIKNNRFKCHKVGHRQFILKCTLELYIKNKIIDLNDMVKKANEEIYHLSNYLRLTNPDSGSKDN